MAPGERLRRGGGPGGWLLLFQAELQIAGHVLVPDLSPSTEVFDRTKKARVYAALGVPHMWLVHPRLRTVEVMRLHDGKWLTLAVHTDEETVRAEPFDAIEIDLAKLWTDMPLRASEPSALYGA